MKTIAKNEKFDKDHRLKILELFGGIGAPRKALENLGIDTKHIDYVEVLNWAVLAYNKMYNKDYKQQSVVHWNLDVDILIHGSPCQDFSQAGKGVGGEVGAGTRSSLMWETVDIIKNRLNKLPKVVIWENVKGVLNKNHKPTFDKYLNALEEIGYENKFEILNSKDFGIPQTRNRVFVVSILKKEKPKWLNKKFSFENIEKKETDLRLKDFLEPQQNVDEWYYIKQPSMMKAIERKKIKVIDNVVETITTKQWRWNNAGVLKIPLTTFNAENYIRNPEEALSSTITAGGANSRQKIAVALKYEETPKGLKVKKTFTPEYEMELKDSENYFIIPRDSDGELIGGSYNRIWKEDKLSGTIATGHSKDQIKIAQEVIEPIPGIPIFIIDNKPYHLRILTERECWRLMGFTDKDIDTVMDHQPPIPRTGLYHLAGNSIVVQVLEAIFKELIKGV